MKQKWSKFLSDSNIQAAYNSPWCVDQSLSLVILAVVCSCDLEWYQTLQSHGNLQAFNTRTLRQKCREAVTPECSWRRQLRVECTGGVLLMLLMGQKSLAVVIHPFKPLYYIAHVDKTKPNQTQTSYLIYTVVWLTVGTPLWILQPASSTPCGSRLSLVVYSGQGQSTLWCCLPIVTSVCLFVSLLELFPVG